MTSSASSPGAEKTQAREAFSSRNVFVFAAIGSAVGLGNIWRFPYVAFDNGGGAFLVPYVIALLTAGIPLLFFDYSIGHRFRGSAPLAFRRLDRRLEPIGWFQVLVALIIAVYYAAIIGWATWYAFFSVDKRFGSSLEETTSFFTDDFLQMSDSSFSLDFVPKITIMIAIVWIATIAVLALGVQKGIGRLNQFFIPLLIVLFVVMVVFALFQDGATDGLNQFFTPDWSVLSNYQVWIAAYGQIFFSLSVGFGIMVTYSSYLDKKTNLTSSGLVVAFSNSAFEVLAGIGVFAGVGFLIHAGGMGWDDVQGGVGLAFFTFPAMIAAMPGGPIFGVLFFACLVLAGFTSLISIVEVVIAAVRDKLAVSRLTGTLLVCVPLAVISLLLMPTATGLMTLDTLDAFSNQVGIVACALLSIIAVALTGKLGGQKDHLNAVSSFELGKTWYVFLFATVVVLAVTLFLTVEGFITDGYEEYPAEVVNTWGWGALAMVLVLGTALTFTPWKRGLELSGVPGRDPQHDFATTEG